MPYANKNDPRRLESYKKYREKNKEIRRAKAREYGKKRPRQPFRRPGFYLDLLETQNYVCAICNQPERNLNKEGKIKSLAIDHDHKTNLVRGLLCQTCNLMLGYAGDDIEILKKAGEYLGRPTTNYMVKTYRRR